jgi:hydroxyethylthiazole kinase-like uncharacterized protein yjeF
MRAAWRAEDVRTSEAPLIATLPADTLMLRAAAGLARRCAVLLASRGRVYGSRVVLLVGPGNNGGDALFAGALLAGRGVAVRALLTSPDRTHAAGLAALRVAGGSAAPVKPSGPGLAGGPDHALGDRPDLIIDGLVGTGARGGLRDVAAEVVTALEHERGSALVVAVDVPSGVEVDSGAVEGPVLRADVTVTFGCLKPALVVGPAAPLAGQVEVVDIGVPTPQAAPAVFVPDAADITGWWPVTGPASDKYTRGVAGLVTGSTRFPGAAHLSVMGALAGPAGMVRYVGPVAAEVVSAHPSVIATQRVADTGRVQAWLCGSGLGQDHRAQRELRAVLGADVPVVLDADALNEVSTTEVRDLLRRRSAPTILTPHDREFARIDGSIGPDRLAAARGLATRLGIVVLLKGDRTIVAEPDGTAWVNPTATSALASAGTGDVLAGFLVSLVAAGVPAGRAAVMAAFVHGLAGRLAATRLVEGSAPVTSADVAAALPAAVSVVHR